MKWITKEPLLQQENTYNIATNFGTNKTANELGQYVAIEEGT